jgi:integrase
MAVKVVEIPVNSGKWYVRVAWAIKGQPNLFRKTKLVSEGESGMKEAEKKAAILNEAWKKMGAEAVRLVEDSPAIPYAPIAPPPLPAEPAKIVPTVNEYGPFFLKRVQAVELKNSTYKCYESNLRNHIYPGIGEMTLDKVDYTAIADLLSNVASSTYSTARFRNKNKKKKLPKAKLHKHGRDSIRLICATLRSMMAEAVKDKYIGFNPVVGLSKFYRKKKKDQIVTRADIFETLADLHKVEDQILIHYPQYYEFTLCMSREGMRIGEVIPMGVSDVNFERRTFNIDKNLPSGTGKLENSAKTDSSEREEEFWSPQCLDAIGAMLKRRRAEHFQKGRRPPKLLFLSKEGYRINYSNYSKAFKKAQKLAGMMKILSPHSLRHTWASQNIAAGEDIASVSRHLGHANSGVTLTIYTHFIPKAKRYGNGVMDKALGANELQMEPIISGGKC